MLLATFAVSHPRARPVAASAPALGADTARTLSELGIGH